MLLQGRTRQRSVALCLHIGVFLSTQLAADCPPPLLPPARHMDVLLALQPAGPHVLVGYGPFSCMLAYSIACELEHHGGTGGGTRGASLLLVDGAPVPPVGLPAELPHPAAYALFSLLLEAGALLPHAGLWHSFVDEYNAALAFEAARGSSGEAAEIVLRALAGGVRPSGGIAAAQWDAAVERAAVGSQLAAHLLEAFETPEYVFQGEWGSACALWKACAGEWEMRSAAYPLDREMQARSGRASWPSTAGTAHARSAVSGIS